MSRQAVLRTISAYFLLALAIGAAWTLAMTGLPDLRPVFIFGNVLGKAIAVFVMGGILPMIFWAFGRFRAQKAIGPLTAWPFLLFLFALAAIYEDSYEGAVSFANVPANFAGFLSSDYDTFVRVVRNSCTDNQKKRPAEGVSATQVATFCDCYANALAKELTAYELKVALRRGDMTPQAKDKVTRVAPPCRRLAFGR